MLDDQGDAGAEARATLGNSSWKVVLAHALAAQGARLETDRLLRAIRAEHGPAVLAFLSMHRGPASPAAEAIAGAPYR
jgi:hypothetical protein